MHMIRNFLGKGGATKSDEFSERLQRAVAPSPTPQNGPDLWKSCACISHYLFIISPRIYATISVIKN